MKEEFKEYDRCEKWKKHKKEMEEAFMILETLCRKTDIIDEKKELADYRDEKYKL